MSDSLWLHGLQPTRLLCPWNFPGKNTGVGCHFLLQFIIFCYSSPSWLIHPHCYPFQRVLILSSIKENRCFLNLNSSLVWLLLWDFYLQSHPLQTPFHLDSLLNLRLYFKSEVSFSSSTAPFSAFPFPQFHLIISKILPFYNPLSLLQGFPGGTSGKEPICQCKRCKRRVWLLGQEDPPEEDIATHSHILAWRIPWTEEPSRLLVHRVAKSLTQLNTHASLLQIKKPSFLFCFSCNQLPTCDWMISIVL